MKKKILCSLFVLLSPLFMQAQHTNGIIGGVNYSWYDHVNYGETQSPALGYQLGYRFEWQLAPKWSIGIGASLNLSHVSLSNGNEDLKELIGYATCPLTVSYQLYKELSLIGGYQFGYLLDEELSNTNRRDHAALLGVNYNFGFCQARLLYQHSLNTEKYESGYISGDEHGNISYIDVQEYSRSKLSAFQLLLYIPLNRKNRD